MRNILSIDVKSVMYKLQKFWNENKDTIIRYAFLIIVFILGIIIRVNFFPISSGDLKNAFIKWYNHIKDNGGFKALSTMIGNYPPMYHYLLWLISLTNLPAITAIKFISVIFDFLISIYVMKIVELKEGKNAFYSAIAFAVTFCLPTVIYNSSFWGQCDSIYTCFFIMFIFYFMKGNDRIAMIMVGFSFAFKLQGVFIFPIVGILVFLKKIRWRMLLWIPVVYFISIIPETLAGRSFIKLLTFYKTEPGRYSLLTLGLPNIWFLVGGSGKRTGAAGVYFSMVVILSFMYYYVSNKKMKITKNTIIGIATLTAFVVPFVLPHMHERYYYFAEIMIVVFGFYYRKTAFLILLSQWNSMQLYIRYLSGKQAIDGRILALMWIVNAIVIFYVLQKEILNPTDDREIMMDYELKTGSNSICGDSIQKLLRKNNIDDNENKLVNYKNKD